MDEKVIKPETYIALDVYNWNQVIDFLSAKKMDLMYNAMERLKIWEHKGERIGITKKEKIYKPVWLIKGFYSCEYLRDTLYRVKVDDNVIMSSKGEEKFEVKKSTDGSSFVIIPNIVEQVKIYNEKTLQIKDYPQEETVEKGFLDRFTGGEKTTKTLNWQEIKMEKTDSVTQYLNEHVDPSFKFSILNPTKSSESIVNKLKENIVKHPTDAKEILKEEFVVSEFKLVFCPFYSVELESTKGKTINVEIDALTFDYTKHSL